MSQLKIFQRIMSLILIFSTRLLSISMQKTNGGWNREEIENQIIKKNLNKMRTHWTNRFKWVEDG